MKKGYVKCAVKSCDQEVPIISLTKNDPKPYRCIAHEDKRKGKIKLLSLVLFPLVGMLSGCVTVSKSASIFARPPVGAQEVAVTATATAKCYDFIGIQWCRLWLDMSQAGQ